MKDRCDNMLWYCRYNHPFHLLQVIAFVVLFAENGLGQKSASDDSLSSVWNFDQDSIHQTSLISLCTDKVQPQLLSDVQTVRAYIRDERFQKLRKQYDDVCAVDFIFLKALQTTGHDIKRALFVSFLAVLEHRVIHMKIPFHLTIPILLTFESDSSFIARLRHLPNNIYSDSPRGIARDRDKLQHFFGSAYLAYTLEQPAMVQVIGNLLEWAEPGMVAGGENDPRDKRANLQGEQFGRDISIVNTLLPSDYLTLPYKDVK
jgi:hypothetical protein